MYQGIIKTKCCQIHKINKSLRNFCQAPALSTDIVVLQWVRAIRIVHNDRGMIYHTHTLLDVIWRHYKLLILVYVLCVGGRLLLLLLLAGLHVCLHGLEQGAGLLAVDHDLSGGGRRFGRLKERQEKLTRV